MEMASSQSLKALVYFLAMCATRRRLCSMSLFFAPSSPFLYFSSKSSSSLLLSCLGNEFKLDIYPISTKSCFNKRSINISPLLGRLYVFHSLNYYCHIYTKKQKFLPIYYCILKKLCYNSML